MATESDMKTSILLEATADEKQVQQEANKVADTAQKTLSKKDLQIQYKENLKELKVKLENTRVAYENLVRTAKTGAQLKALDQMELQLTDIKNQIKETETALSDMGASSWPFEKIKNFFAGGAIVAGATSIGKKIIELGMNAEQAKISFTTMLGDAGEAQNLLKDLSDFAKKTPFDLQGIRENAKQLMAMGVNAEDMIPTLKALGDVAAGLNVPLERLALNYGQVLTQGKLTGKELKDFTAAGVPLLDELSKNLGKSKTEIQNMVSQGKISAKDMVDAFDSMTSAGGKFADLMEAQSKTLAGKWSNLQDTIAGIGEEIGLSLVPILSDVVDEAANAGDNINNMGEQGITASEMISRGIAVVLNWFRSIILGIKTIGKWRGSLASSIGVIFESIASAGIDAFGTLGNNIKVWIAKGLNDAIAEINKFSKWVNDKLGTSFGQIGKVNAGEFKQFENPLKDIKNAWDGAKNYMWDTIKEIGSDWSNFAEKVTAEFDNIRSVYHGNAVAINNENKKIVKQLTKELTDNTNGAGKKSSEDLLKQQKENLKKLRDLKIQEIQESTAGEREKNEKLLEVYDWYKNELVKLDGKTNDELLKSAEDYIKEYYKKMQDASEKEQKLTTDSINKAKKYQDAIEKLGDQWDEYKDKAVKNIREVNNSIDELDKKFNQDIGERYNEVQELIKDFQRKNGEQDWLKSLGVDRLKDRDSEKINDIPIKDAIEYLEALKEMEYLNSKLTESQKELAKTLDQQSESEKLILEYEKQRAVLEEQRSIYQAVANQWDLSSIGEQAIKLEDDIVSYYDATKDKYVEITDFKNQELARDLYNQQIKLEAEYEQQETALQTELELVENHSKKVLAQWQSDTKAYKNELNNRLDAVRDYVASVQALLASVPSSYRAYGGELNKGVTIVGENWPEAIVRRQASYVQPRNASNSYSTVNNNQSSFAINWLNVNVSNVDEFLGELKNRLTYRN